MSKPVHILFTENGFKKIKQDYDELFAKRPSYVEELTRARDMGDRSENAAYKSARRTLSSTDNRLRFLKRLVDNAKVVKPINNEYVEIGSSVKVETNEREFTFYIVGEHEADPNTQKLSYKSPVGKSLLGKKQGDTIHVSVPSGIIEYLIKEIMIV